MNHGGTGCRLRRRPWLRVLAAATLGTTLSGCFLGGANYANQATTLTAGQLIGAWWNERSGSVLILGEDDHLTVAGLPAAAADEHPVLQPVGQRQTGQAIAAIAEGQWSCTEHGEGPDATVDGFEQWVILRLQTYAGKVLPPEVELDLRVELVADVPAITLYLGDGGGEYGYFKCDGICPAGARH